jgi:hypothetical protein
MKFYHYLQNNRDGLVDLKYRPCPQAALAWNPGAIEGNVDKLVVHRMKGRGCSWRLSEPKPCWPCAATRRNSNNMGIIIFPW